MQKESRSLQVEIDDATAKGTYANFALISHTETEFVLDFVLMQPQSPKAKVQTRVISSPIHAKRLLWALEENIRRFESSFGRIAAGPKPEEAQEGTVQ